MASWLQFETECPELAALIRARFEQAETHVLATLRKDGSPRVSGSEVAFVGPDLTIGSMPGARKARDLQRDGRCAIHAHPSGEGDAKVAGIAIEVAGDDILKGQAAGSHAFRIELQEAVMTRVEDNELVVRLWRPGRPLRTFRRT